MLFVHIILSIVTMGLWPVVMIFINYHRTTKLEEKQQMIAEYIMQSQANERENTQIRRAS